MSICWWNFVPGVDIWHWPGLDNGEQAADQITAGCFDNKLEMDKHAICKPADNTKHFSQQQHAVQLYIWFTNVLLKSLSNKEPSHRIIKYLATQLSNQVLKYFWEQNDLNSI